MFGLWEAVLTPPSQESRVSELQISGMCQVQHMAVGPLAPSRSLLGKEKRREEVGKGVSPFKQG